MNHLERSRGRSHSWAWLTLTVNVIRNSAHRITRAVDLQSWSSLDLLAKPGPTARCLESREIGASYFDTVVVVFRRFPPTEPGITTQGCGRFFHAYQFPVLESRPYLRLEIENREPKLSGKGLELIAAFLGSRSASEKDVECGLLCGAKEARHVNLS